MDNLPLVKSRRILCCAVGNSANTGSYIDDKGYFESHKSPILTEPVTATIFAKAVDTMPLKVYKKDPATGERISEMNITVKDNIESFTIDKNSKTMYFELVR
jgi:hypothetical protein